MRELLARSRQLLLGLLLALAWVTGAAAHAQLLGTTPAQNAVSDTAPNMAQLDFSEPVTALAIGLVAPDGERTDLLDATKSGATVTVPLPIALGGGTHVLSWRVVSVDGHPIGGSLIFSVGEVTGAAVAAPEYDRLTSTALWASKALFYVCLFLGAGGAVFGLAAPLPASLRLPLAGLTGAGLLVAPISLGFHGLDALGLPLTSFLEFNPWAAGAGTSYGISVLVAMIALATALTALLAPPFKVLGWLTWALGGLALALSGHASAAEPQWLTRPAVFLHVTGILFWVGALVPLLVHLRARWPDSEAALSRFSRFVPFAVAPFLVSGVVLAAIQLGSPGPQWFSAYAYILATKLGLLAVLFSLALWNRLRLTKPALSGNLMARHRLELSVRAEIVIALIVLGLVAGWRFTPPPRALAQVAAVAQSEPLVLHLMEGNVMAMATIDPGRAGLVTLDIAITDATGAPTVAAAVAVPLSAPGLGSEPFRRAAGNVGGAWRVTDLPIPVSGNWHLELDIRMSRFSLVKLQSDISIP